MADFQTVVKTVKIVTDASGAKAGGQEAQAAFEALEHKIDSAKEHLESFHSGLETAADRLKEFAAVVGVAFTAEKIYEFTEAWEKATVQIEAVVGSAEGAAFAMDKIYESSQRSRTAIAGNVETFSRLMIVQDQLGASQNELAKFTESVSTAMALMGKGSDATAGMVGNFTRSLASGTVGTREFRTILADTPALAEAMAQHIDGAGGSIQRLRDMMAAGKVSSQEFFQAIIAALPEMQARLGELPVTTGQAVTQLENSLQQFMGHLNEATGATHTLAEGIVFLSDHLDTIARVFGVVAAGAAALAGVAALGALPAILGAVTTAFGYLTAAMLANPFTAAIVVVTAFVAELYLFRDATVQVTGVTTTLGTAIRAAWETAGNWIDNAVTKLEGWAKDVTALASGGLPALRAQMDANAQVVLKNTDYTTQLSDAQLRIQLENANTGTSIQELVDGWNAHGAAANTSTDATQKQIDAFKKLVGTLDPLQKALDDYSKREEEIEQGRKLHIATQQQLNDLQAASFDQLILDTRAAQEKVDVVGTMIEKINLDTQATALELAGRKDLADALKLEYDLRLKLVNVTPEQIKAIQDATAALEAEKKALKDHQTELDNAQRTAERTFKAEVQFSQQSATEIVTSLENMAEGAKRPFDNLLQYAKKILLEMVAAYAVQPLILNVVTSMTGIGGAVGGAAGAANALGVAGSLGGSAGMFSGLAASAGSWLNGVGASSGMFGNGMTLASQVFGNTGAATTGALGGTATLTGVLGAAGLGALGGNVLAGLLGENKTGGSIGGGIGAAIGMMTPLGPLGALLGGALGSVIGGLFGGGKSNNTGVSNIDLASGGLTYGAGDPRKVDQGNISTAQNIGTVVQQLTGALSQIAGSPAAGRAYFEAGSRDGIHANVQGQDANFSNDAAGSASAIDFAVKKIADSFGSKLPPEIITALDHVDFSNVTKAVADLDFAANFQANVKAMSEGIKDFKSSAEGAAAAQIQQTVQAIQEFRDTTARLGLDTDAANVATKKYVENLLGMGAAAPAVSATQAAFDTLDGTLEGLKPLLDEVGISFGDAAAAIQKAKDAIKDNYAATLQQQIDEANHSFLKSTDPLFAQYLKDLPDATTLGLGDKLQERLKAQLGEAFSGMNADQLQAVIDWYKTVSGGQVAVDAATDALKRLKGTTDSVAQSAADAAKAQQALTTFANDNLKAVQTFLQQQTQLIANFKQQADAWQKVSESLGGTAQSLLTNSALSPLSPGDQFAAAQAAYNTISAKAASGDLTAAGQLGQASTDYLTAAKNYFGGGADYYARFQQVQSTLLNTKTAADVQVSLAQQQAASLQQVVNSAQKELDRLDSLINGSKAQVTTLQGMWDTLKAVAGLVPGLNAQAETPNVRAPSGSTSPTRVEAVSARVSDPATTELRAGFTMQQAQLNNHGEALESIATDMAAVRASLERAAA